MLSLGSFFVGATPDYCMIISEWVFTCKTWLRVVWIIRGRSRRDRSGMQYTHSSLSAFGAIPFF